MLLLNLKVTFAPICTHPPVHPSNLFYFCLSERSLSLHNQTDGPHCLGQLPHNWTNIEKSSWFHHGAFTTVFWSLWSKKLHCRLLIEKKGGALTQTENLWPIIFPVCKKILGQWWYRTHGSNQVMSDLN